MAELFGPRSDWCSPHGLAARCTCSNPRTPLHVRYWIVRRNLPVAGLIALCDRLSGTEYITPCRSATAPRTRHLRRDANLAVAVAPSVVFIVTNTSSVHGTALLRHFRRQPTCSAGGEPAASPACACDGIDVPNRHTRPQRGGRALPKTGLPLSSRPSPTLRGTRCRPLSYRTKDESPMARPRPYPRVRREAHDRRRRDRRAERQRDGPTLSPLVYAAVEVRRLSPIPRPRTRFFDDVYVLDRNPRLYSVETTPERQ